MKAADALAALACAYEAPETGGRVVRTVGSDAPFELIRAAGFTPVRLAPARGETPRADAVAGNALGPRGRRLLEALLDPALRDTPILITHADAEQPQIFAALRELRRLGEDAPGQVHFLDLLHIDRPSSAAYNRARLAQMVAWLESLGGRESADLDAVLAQSAEQARLLRELRDLRRRKLLSGSQMLRIVGSAAVLPMDEHIALLRAVLADADALPPVAGEALFVTGNAHEQAALYERIEAAGFVIVGEDHAWGDPFADTVPANGDLEDPKLRVPAPLQSAQNRAQALAERVQASGAEKVLHLAIDGDEAAPWDIASIRAALAVPLVTARTRSEGDERLDAAIEQLRSGEAAPVPKHTAPAAAARPSSTEGRKSRKSLRSIASFNAYQREWFAEVRQRVADGEPFAVVNANAPQEILRAMDIPFVVNQWWASIVAAKQQSRRYLGLLRTHDFPTDIEAYSAQALAAAFDEDTELAPWAGLPRPGFVQAVASSDPTAKIFEHMARATGAERFLYERTVDPRPAISTDWWSDLPDRWDEVLEPERLDLLVAEMRDAIGQLERATGRRFSQSRFEEVMALVNEQEEYYRRTRDLIAASRPVPIGVVDSMPATMVPQWHRGTVWARDAARAFHDEVAERVATGEAAVPNERVRLMWVGRGMWSEMGFYQQWEESHGAVFVWSMYLGLAADGYIRRYDRGRDPMRALAARFVTMGDELRMPGWAGPWHVHEARTHSVDGAVALADADPFVIRALRAAGIPVLELGVDNFSGGSEDAEAIAARVTAFIEEIAP